MAPFDGAMTLTLKGTRERPITINAAGDGEVVFDGAGSHYFFNVMASSHHIFDGLTIRNTDVAILAGQKDVTGAVGLTVKNCRFENVGFGVWTEYAGSSDFYIADNLFLGRDDRFRLIGWTGPLWASAGPYGSHQLTSYYAIKVYGPGHVIARNAIAYFHDGIGISTYGTPEPDPERRASSIDIYGNDIHMSNDDFVETDGGVHNIRVFDNRGVNAAHGGYSAQPVFGGPVYFIRNLSYHVPSGVAFKFSAKPAGLFVYHNTIIGEQVARDPSANVHFRNNLFLGRDTPDRGIMAWANATAAFSSDYNGYRPNAGVAAQYAWLAPAAGAVALRADARAVEDVPHARRAARRDRPGGARDRSGLRRSSSGMTPPDPAKRHAVYHAMDLDFRLKPAAKRWMRASSIPTVNDGFAGRAPDLGALEVGEAGAAIRAALDRRGSRSTADQTRHWLTHARSAADDVHASRGFGVIVRHAQTDRRGRPRPGRVRRIVPHGGSDGWRTPATARPSGDDGGVAAGRSLRCDHRPGRVPSRS